MDQVGKNKVCLELNSVRDMKGNKKGFYRYISSQRKSKGNKNLLQEILFSY